MKKQRFSTEQIVSVLKQAEMGLPVKITEQTFYRWKRQYGGLESELKQVVEENARLKRLVAKLSLDKPVLSLSKGRFCRTCCQKVPRPALMKDVVAYVVSSHGYSERQACQVTRQHRSTQRKPSTRDPRTEVRRRMHEIVATRIRYGYAVDAEA